ncbi:MAG: hypothetical protein IJL93_02620 [Bacteroidales bacterium]|nr:hypothetical protein [Bacteroidales bacterium]
MKRSIILILLAVSILTSGCYDSYYDKVDELRDRLEDLELACEQINRDISSLRSLVQVIESQDMITGITEIRSGSSVLGYRINFVQHDPVTIVNGKDGNKPLVSSQRDSEDGNYYWTVQYGDGTSQWLLAPDGSKMLSIGLLPYVTIRDGWFCYTTDGKEWIRLAKADGESGDQLFTSIDTRYKNYVLFTLATGETLKIPTYSAYLSLKEEFDKVNDNTDAQIKLVQADLDKLNLYISRVDPLLSGKDTVGLTVSLSNGQRFRIHDWTASLSPTIFIKKHSDGKLYWAYTIGSSPEQWVLSPEGNKVPATSDAVEIPIVSVTQDKDGQYYWTVTSGGNTEFLRFKVDDNWTPLAVDSVARAFRDVRNYSDSLVVILKDSVTRFCLPKQYTVSITDEKGKAVDDSITMTSGQEVRLQYVASGPSASLSLIAQGGFTATAESAGGKTYIRIKAPESFTDSSGKILAIFSFSVKNAPVTVFKTIKIKKGE